jgi:hypothetical protein
LWEVWFFWFLGCSKSKILKWGDWLVHETLYLFYPAVFFGSWHITCFCLLAEVLLSLQPHLPVDLITFELLTRHSSSLIAAYDHSVMILSTNTAHLDPLWVYLVWLCHVFLCFLFGRAWADYYSIIAPSVRSWWSP